MADAEKKENQNTDEQKQSSQKQMFGLYLSNLTVFPGIEVYCDIANKDEASTLLNLFEKHEQIVCVTSKNPEGKNPLSKENLFEYGCVATIIRCSNQKGVLKISLGGDKRAKICDVLSASPLLVIAQEVEETNQNSQRANQLANELKAIYTQNPIFYNYFSPELENRFLNQNLTTSQFADIFSHILSQNLAEQQKVLAELDVEKRLEIARSYLDKHATKIVVRKEIDQKVNASLNKSQKEMFLREQLKVINKELYGDEDECETYRNKIKALKLKKSSERIVLKEIDKLAKQPFGSPEASYIRNYLDTILDLPWSEKTEDNLDLKKAQQVLDEDHYALEKVKERIIQSLAVIKLTENVGAQIICLVGPPGVGKTSIAKSIARAMGREFVQQSLGGVNDEAVIRGHRRTYVGAMCGCILSGMKQAKTINPVFLLDEVDKLTSNIKGDPSSALLEVLDPEQNNNFKDNYLEIPYDLSQVLFILTANTLDTIPIPLLDRMEIIELRSYTEIEKIHIAQNYLIEKEEKRCGLKPGTVPFSEEILKKIINDFTYEAGVRSLERQIGSICRVYATFEAGIGNRKELNITNISEFLNKQEIHEPDMFAGGNVGEVVGLSVTSIGVGHTILIESTVIPGDEKITLTGKFGTMMQESAKAAFSLCKRMAPEFGIEQKAFEKKELHIHIPQVPGGVEGPSAGIAMTTAIVSSFTGKRVKPHLAMTGEVSLAGRVLPIGGVRDKLMAAVRVGVKTIILPVDNEKDLKELPSEVKDVLDIHLVSNIKEVINLALEN